jgi:hypothetical protein
MFLEHRDEKTVCTLLAAPTGATAIARPVVPTPANKAAPIRYVSNKIAPTRDQPL